jgi:hypothetical protein
MGTQGNSSCFMEILVVYDPNLSNVRLSSGFLSIFCKLVEPNAAYCSSFFFCIFFGIFFKQSVKFYVLNVSPSRNFIKKKIKKNVTPV